MFIPRLRRRNTEEATAAAVNDNHESVSEGYRQINVAGIKTNKEYPYRQTTVTILTCTLNCLRMNHRPVI
jgi:hypothetical protein